MGILGLIGSIIALIVIAIICRALRARFKVVDIIVTLSMLATFIITWIFDGFWMGLLYFFCAALIARLFFGIGGSSTGTTVRKFGYEYTLKCKKCRYEDLEILEHTDDGVITQCKRCGYTQGHILNH